MLNRRGFIGTLVAAAAGLVLDPERALWVPGQKTIFLPTPVMAFGNSFVTPEWVTKDTAVFWRESIRYEGQILNSLMRGATIGNSIRVRRPSRMVMA